MLLRNAQPGSSIASVRERIGTLTANAGMRIKDIVIEGRANTPEPILRAALGVNKGDPIIGFSLEQARDADRETDLGRARHGGTSLSRNDRRGVLLERRPFAIWQNQGKYTLIDRDGQA